MSTMRRRWSTISTNLGLTAAVMVLLIADILPLPYLFMIGTVIALMVNFPTVKDQQEELAICHRRSPVVERHLRSSAQQVMNAPC